MNSKILGSGMVGIGALIMLAFVVTANPLNSNMLDFGSFSVTDDATQVHSPIFATVECEAGPVTNTRGYNFPSDPYKQTTTQVMYKLDLEASRNSPDFDLQARDTKSITGYLGEETSDSYSIIVKTKDPSQSESEYEQVTVLDDGGVNGETTDGGTYSWTNVKTGIEKSKDIRLIYQTARYVNGASPDQVDVRLKYQRYDLKTDAPTLPQTISEGTCDVSKVGEEWFNSDLEEAQSSGALSGTELGFGKSFSVVVGTTPVTEPLNAIDDNGDGTVDKYITRVTPNGGMYYPIEETNEGNLYVDSRAEKGPLTNIVCSPASPYCASDGTEEIDIEDKEGGQFSGGVTGYLPSGESGEVCTYEMVNGELQSDNCKNIPDCGEGEFLDQNYECSDQTEVVDPPQDDIPLWLIAIAAFAGTMIFGGFFVIMIAIAATQN